MTSWRRFEVMVPIQPDGGPEIIWEFIGTAMQEISEGRWWKEHPPHRNCPVRLVVEVPDLAEHRNWMTRLKDRCKQRLQRPDIWMVSYRIEIE